MYLGSGEGKAMHHPRVRANMTVESMIRYKLFYSYVIIQDILLTYVIFQLCNISTHFAFY